MALSVVSSDPVADATGVDPTGKLRVTFNLDLSPTTVTHDNVVLFETDIGKLVGVSISVAGPIITVIPNKYLREEQNYTLVLVGKNENSPGGYLKGDDGDELGDSYKLNFRTSVSTYVRLSEVTSRTDIERVGPIRATTAEEEATTGSLLVLSSSPVGFSTNKDNVSTVSLVFSEALPSDAADYLSLEQEPVLGLSDYEGAAIDGVDTLRLKDEDNAAFNDATGTWAINGTQAVFALDSGQVFKYNQEILVRIDADLKSSDGLKSMVAETIVLFTTKFFTLYSSARVLRLECGPVLNDIGDDTLNRLILKNSIDAWEWAARKFTYDAPIRHAARYARWQSVVDALGVIQLRTDINSGKSWQLGDFSVKTGKVSDPGLLSRARVQADDSLKALKRVAIDGGMTHAIRGAQWSGERGDYRTRTWEHSILSSVPADNMNAARIQKLISAQGTPTTIFLGRYGLNAKPEPRYYISPL